MRELGLDAWGIDYKGGRLEPETPAFLMYDLTWEVDAKAAWRLLEHPALAYAHFAPPVWHALTCA